MAISPLRPSIWWPLPPPPPAQAAPPLTLPNPPSPGEAGDKHLVLAHFFPLFFSPFPLPPATAVIFRAVLARVIKVASRHHDGYRAKQITGSARGSGRAQPSVPRLFFEGAEAPRSLGLEFPTRCLFCKVNKQMLCA